jgi:hypothetical protein
MANARTMRIIMFLPSAIGGSACQADYRRRAPKNDPIPCHVATRRYLVTAQNGASRGPKKTELSWPFNSL